MGEDCNDSFAEIVLLPRFWSQTACSSLSSECRILTGCFSQLLAILVNSVKTSQFHQRGSLTHHVPRMR